MKKAIQIITVLLLAAALTVCAGATSFVPSVEQKGAPDAFVVDDTGRNIIVTPLADAEETSKEIRQALEEAYESIDSAESLEEAAPVLTDALEVLAPELTVDDLVIRDLLYVRILDMAQGETVVVNFDLKLEENALLIPMLLVDGEWVLVEPQLIDPELDTPDLVTIKEDGTVNVGFTAEENIIAFVTTKTE